MKPVWIAFMYGLLFGGLTGFSLMCLLSVYRQNGPVVDYQFKHAFSKPRREFPIVRRTASGTALPPGVADGDFRGFLRQPGCLVKIL